MKGGVYVGTSGWSYRHWKGRFYPADLPAGEMLAHYAQSFRTAEINNSFYRLPERRSLESWRRSVPAEFVFSAKASRYITHMKKLKDPKASSRTFFRRIRVLGEALGPVLFQLPPRWSFNEGRLGDFLDALSGDFRYAFEFRDRSWINDRALALLSDHGAAFCIYELEGFLSPAEITADFTYIRLHGPHGAYRGRYDKRALRRWATTFSAWSEQGRAVYCYFDNDENAYAAHNALELQSML